VQVQRFAFSVGEANTEATKVRATMNAFIFKVLLDSAQVFVYVELNCDRLVKVLKVNRFCFELVEIKRWRSHLYILLAYIPSYPLNSTCLIQSKTPPCGNRT